MLFKINVLLALMAGTAVAVEVKKIEVCPGASTKKQGTVYSVFSGSSVNPWGSATIGEPTKGGNMLDCANRCDALNKGSADPKCRGFELYNPTGECRIYEGWAAPDKVGDGQGDVGIPFMPCNDANSDIWGYGDKRDSCCEVWMERNVSTSGGTTGLSQMPAPSD